MKIRSLIAVAIAVGVVAAGCSSSSDPAAVVADYLEVWNSEDEEAVMVFYTEDAVLEGHPSDPDGLTTGKSEILVIETRLNGLQGSTGTMEYLNMEVSGDTVTFDNIFRNGSGVRSTGTSVRSPQAYPAKGVSTSVQLPLQIWASAPLSTLNPRFCGNRAR